MHNWIFVNFVERSSTLTQRSSLVMIPRNSQRIQKELRQLLLCPGPGVLAFADEQDFTKLNAQIIGPDDTPYAGGVFNLKIDIPENYPFEPPRVHFVTPVYHPNIDSEGRICLDTLKPQPQGSWSPSVNINTLLLTLRLLLAHPNADDGLVPEITEEYRRSFATYVRKATEHTQKYAAAQSSMEVGATVADAGEGSAPVVGTAGSSTVGSTTSRPVAERTSDVDHLQREEQEAPVHTEHPRRAETTSGRYRICAGGYTLLGCSAAGLPHLRSLLRALEEREKSEAGGGEEDMSADVTSQTGTLAPQQEEGSVGGPGKRKRSEADHSGRKRG